MLHLRFALAFSISLALFGTPLLAVVRLSLGNYLYSQLILIPFIAAFLIYWRRNDVFVAARWSLKLGIPVVIFGAAVYGISRIVHLSNNSDVSLAAFGIVVVWIGAFVLCYGARAFRAALFPLLFLILFVPAPGAILDRIVAVLQRGSCETTHLLFRVIGMPVFREGFQFSMPGFSIEIAPECSSIRSGTALFLTSLLAGYAAIRSPWRRAFLAALTLPIAVFTNGVRIVALSWLTLHVDRGFLSGDLHHRGGALFSLISVAALLIAVFALSEEKLRWRRSAAPMHPPKTPLEAGG